MSELVPMMLPILLVLAAPSIVFAESACSAPAALDSLSEEEQTEPLGADQPRSHHPSVL